jgi:hypothetical protein
LATASTTTAPTTISSITPASDDGTTPVSDDETVLTSADRSSLESDNETYLTLRTWVAPESAELSNLSDVRAAKASGNLTRTDLVAENDTLVLELGSPGLSSAITAQNESNATARFRSWLATDGASLRVREATPGPSKPAIFVNVTDPGAATVIPDRDDTYYLVVDTETVPVTDDYEPTGDRTDLRWSEYRANFTLTNESGLVGSRTSVEDEVEVRPRDAGVVTEFGSNRVHVASAPNRSVSVKTSLAPGSKMTVVVEGPGEPFPLEATGQVRNASDGFVFAPTFDFSVVPPGTEFTVTVSHPGESQIEYGGSNGHGVVTEPTASVEWQTVSEQDASVAATLSRGGFVVVRRNATDGEIIGNSAYLEPGAVQTVLVSLDADLDSNVTLVAVAVRDSNADGQFDSQADEPYNTGNYDHRVATSTKVTFAEPRETANGTSLPAGNETTTDVVTEPSSPGDPGIPGVGSPGFGVGAALVALVGGLVALVARRE